MNGREFKQKFLIALLSRDEYIRQVSEVQFQTRCPFCGDSQSNLHTGHFYIRCDINDNFPIVYNCFKCPENGVMNRETLEKLGITDTSIVSSIKDVNKKFVSIDGMNIIIGESFKTFPLSAPDPKHNLWKVKYIENRLGVKVTRDFAKKTKLITSFKDFIKSNEIQTLNCNPHVAKLFEDDYIGFLSYGNSHILFRDVTERNQYSWLKYPILPKSSSNYVAYSLESVVDIFTDETITINLCEGIFDIISICYNLGYNKDNCINMCVCGKSYKKIIERLITQGLFGYNVILNIFSDNDKKYNKGKKNNYDTTLEYYRKAFKEYLILFKEINVYYNQSSKDCGVKRDQISLKKYLL